MKKIFFLGFGIGFIFAGTVMFAINTLNKPTNFTISDAKQKLESTKNKSIIDLSFLKKTIVKNSDLSNKIKNKDKNSLNYDNNLENLNINVSDLKEKTIKSKQIKDIQIKNNKIDKLNDIKKEVVQVEEVKPIKKIINNNSEEIRNSKDILNNYNVVDVSSDVVEEGKFYIIQLRSTRNKETCIAWYKKIKDIELSIVEKDGWYRLITAKMYPKDEAEALTKKFSTQYAIKAIMKENLE